MKIYLGRVVFFSRGIDFDELKSYPEIEFK